jgi:hypothetical protein
MVKLISIIIMTLVLIIKTKAYYISRSRYEGQEGFSHPLVHTVRIAYPHESILTEFSPSNLDFSLAILELYQSNCQ